MNARLNLRCHSHKLGNISLKPNHAASSATKNALVVGNTSHLDQLFGKSVLVILDAENITYSARNLGFEPDYRSMAHLLSGQTRQVAMHAFYSREPANAHFDQAFQLMGWTPHPYTIRTVEDHRGSRKLTNSDHNILFHTGSLVCRHQADTLLIASGDGDLVSDIASGIADMGIPMDVMTLSLRGSTSHRILHHQNAHIAANGFLGQDCLNPYDE